MNIDSYLTKSNIKEKTKNWLQEISDYNFRDVKITSLKSALLIIDMQKFFLTPGRVIYTPSGIAIMDNIKSLLEKCRSKKIPVFYTAQAHKSVEMDRGILSKWWPNTLLESNKEKEVHDDIKPLEHEKIIYKRRYSGFYQTDLELSLRGLGVEDLIITGIMSNICCESTARDGFFRDFRIFFIADATGATDESLHLSTLRNVAFGFGKVLSTEEVLNSM